MTTPLIKKPKEEIGNTPSGSTMPVKRSSSFSKLLIIILCAFLIIKHILFRFILSMFPLTSSLSTEEFARNEIIQSTLWYFIPISFILVLLVAGIGMLFSARRRKTGKKLLLIALIVFAVDFVIDEIRHRIQLEENWNTPVYDPLPLQNREL